MHEPIQNDKGGEGIDAWIVPRCSCGWFGSKHYAYSSYQHSNAREQFERHKEVMRKVESE